MITDYHINLQVLEKQKSINKEKKKQNKNQRKILENDSCLIIFHVPFATANKKEKLGWNSKQYLHKQIT